MSDFLLFLAVGFLAQLVDGSLGMAYGVTATSVMLSLGVPPAQASAATHAAEVFTTGASGASHLAHRNIDWPLFWRLAPAGMIGGAIGAFVLTGIDANVMRPLIAAYLGALGVFILWRVFRPPPPGRLHLKLAPGVGAVGGFLDATGGGGWGPMVTSTLLGAGERPRYAIGTANAAEFLVTVTISAAFVAALLTGHWEQEDGLMRYAASVAGLVVGGVAAAPLAGYVVKIVPQRTLAIAVGVLILFLSAFQLWKIFRPF